MSVLMLGIAPRRRLIAALLCATPLLLGAQAAVVARDVNLRPDASTAHAPKRLLHPGDSLVLLQSRASAGFYHVRAGSDTGFTWAKNVRVGGGEPVAFSAEVAAPGGGAKHPCADPHYRWTEKTTPAKGAKETATVHDILTKWPESEIANTGADWCVGREASEDRIVAISAYVRRVKNQDDGDWHIELTDGSGGTVENNCVVVEIPPVELNAKFKKARADLTKLLGLTSMPAQYDAVTPIRLRFEGSAFFDGEHRGGAANPDTPHAHGRCNSSSRALWEIHPVTAVSAP